MFWKKNAPYRICHQFKIIDNPGIRPIIDKVTHTDGIAVSAFPVLPDYPDGLFVTQDDLNEEIDGRIQNFKYVSWSKIEHGIKKAGICR